jgi:hypothetical protein
MTNIRDVAYAHYLERKKQIAEGKVLTPQEKAQFNIDRLMFNSQMGKLHFYDPNIAASITATAMLSMPHTIIHESPPCEMFARRQRPVFWWLVGFNAFMIGVGITFLCACLFILFSKHY